MIQFLQHHSVCLLVCLFLNAENEDNEETKLKRKICKHFEQQYLILRGKLFKADF